MRSRLIKPGFYANEQLAECSLLARFIFPGLWMMADREGRLEDRPKRIKAALLPYDDGDIESLLLELEAQQLIVRYNSNGIKVIAIPSFDKHQHCHPREAASTLPGNDEPRKGKAKAMPRHDLGKSKDTPRSPVSTSISTSISTSEDLGAPRLGVVDTALWERFKESRKAMRSPVTPHAESLLMAKLEQLAAQGNDPKAVIEQSIERGWKGIFPIDKERKGNGKRELSLSERRARNMAAICGRPWEDDDEGAIQGRAERVDNSPFRALAGDLREPDAADVGRCVEGGVDRDVA